MDCTPATIGDFVCYAESSVRAVGLIVDERDRDYVLVRWEGGFRTTHNRNSLQVMPVAKRWPEKWTGEIDERSRQDQ